MADKNDVTIQVGGRAYTLSGVESPDYLKEVAAYLNDKMREFSDDASFWKLPVEQRNVMLQLNLADEAFKERSRAESLEERIDKIRVQAREDAKKELESRTAALKKQFGDLERDIRGKASAAEAALREQYEERIASLENLLQEKAPLAQELEKSRAEAARLSEECEALRARCEEAETEQLRVLEQLEDERAARKSDTERAEGKALVADKQIGELTAKAGSLAQEGESMRAQADKAKDVLDRHEEVLQENTARMQALIDQSEKEKQAVQQELSLAEEEILRRAESAVKAKEAFEEMRSQESRLAALIQQLSETISALQGSTVR